MPVSFRRLKESDTRTRVEFRVRFTTRHGESVHVVGDIPSLGCWELDQGVPLVTTPESFPYWYTTKPIAILRNQTIKYKYVIFSGGKFSRWETYEGNRSVVVTGAKLTIEDDVDQDILRAADKGEMLDEVNTSTSLGVEETNSSNEESSEVARVRFQLPEATQPTPLHDGSASQRFSSQLSPLETTKGEQTISSYYNDPLSISPARESHPPRGVAPVSTDFARESERYTQRDEPFELRERDRVTVASYFLPVTCRRVEVGPADSDAGSGWEVQWDDNALLSMKPSHIPSEAIRVTYVGCPRVAEALSLDEQEKLTAALEVFNCVPVFVPPRLHLEGYHRYCEGTLKKLFHNIADVFGTLPTRFWNPRSHSDAYKAYREVNHQFADKVVEIYHDADLTWVHGNELLLLPSMLSRRLRQQAHVGFFMHTPFPSSELFRTLSVRKDLLLGMLGANQIGFHVYDYARHFLTCCRRLLGLETDIEKDGSLSVIADGRKVIVSVCHAGIEPEFVLARLHGESVREAIAEHRARLGSGRTVVVGVDAVERLSGIFLKLQALEELLEARPDMRSRICLVQIGVTGAQVESEDGSVYEEPRRWRKELLTQTQRINARYAAPGRPVVYYEERATVTLRERVALWAVGDVFLSTPVSRGLDLHPLEFVAVRGELRRLAQGGGGLVAVAGGARRASEFPVVVLSEFAAAARVLSGCLRVNPWRRDAVVESLLRAIRLPQAEREARGVKDHTYVMHHVMSEWAERVLTRLKRACVDPEHEAAASGKAAEGDQLRYTGLGLGLAFRAVGFRPDFGHADLEVLSRAYRTASKRVILLDFGGTLVADEVQESSYASKRTSVLPDLSPALKSSLLTLVTDPANSVFILSGKECSTLEHAFRNFPQLGFAAEHGFFFSWGKKGSRRVFGRSLTGSRRGGKVLPVPDAPETAPREWEMIDDHFDNSWMEICRNIMEMYKQRTTGTMIEQKGSTLVWKYSDADPDFGAMQATELRDHLRGVLNSFPVIVSPGKGYVEVRPEVCDKGKAAEHVIATVSGQGKEPDFVLAIGDDVADERTFQFLKKYADDRQAQAARPLRVFTCVVGKKPSSARAFLNDVAEVEQLLATLSKVSRTKYLSKSLSDIRDMLNSAQFDDDSQGYDSGPMEDDLDDNSSADRGMDDASVGNNSGSRSSIGGRSPPLRPSGLHYSFSVPTFQNLAHAIPLSSVDEYLQNIEEDTESEDGMGIQF